EQFFAVTKGRQIKMNVGMGPTLSPAIGRTIVMMRDRYPNVQFNVQEAYGNNLIEWLCNGSLDIAFMPVFDGERRVRSLKLATEPLVLVTGAKTPTPRTRVRCADINRYTLVLSSMKSPIRLQLESEFSARGLKLAPALELDSLPAVLNIVGRPGWA